MKTTLAILALVVAMGCNYETRDTTLERMYWKQHSQFRNFINESYSYMPRSLDTANMYSDSADMALYAIDAITKEMRR